MFVINREKLIEQLEILIAKWNKNQANTFMYIVDAGGEICLYSNAHVGFPVRINGKGIPWTFAGSMKSVKSTIEYALLCISTLEKMINEADGIKEFPLAKDMLESNQRETFFKLSDNDYVKYICYLISTNQCCKKCKFGVVECDVGSYYETHTCLNCNDMENVC